MSNDINLYKFKKGKLSSEGKRLSLLRGVAIIALFCISASAVILYILIALSPLPALKKEEENSLNAMSLLHDDEAKEIIVHERMDVIGSILSKRQHFDKIIKDVTSLLPSGLTVTGMSIDDKGASFTIKGSSLSKIDKFINELVNSPQNGTAFSRISLSNLIILDQTNIFSATIAVSYL